jgi:hypothetical protein
MRIFHQDDINRLFTAACDAGLVHNRSALLAHVDDRFVATMRLVDSPTAQLNLDLAALNACNALDDGTVPFATWLSNAVRLSAQPRDLRVFNHYAAVIDDDASPCAPHPRRRPVPESETVRPSPPPPPPPPTSHLGDWAASGLSLLVMAAIAGIFADSGKSWQVARGWGDFVQLAVVILVFVVTLSAKPRVPTGAEGNAPACKYAVEQFNFYWRMLWLTWVVFYTIHATRHFVQHKLWDAGSPPWLWTVGVPWLLNFWGNFQGVNLLILFWMMVRPKEAAEPNDRHIVGWIACVFFSMVEAYLLYSTQHEGAGVWGIRVAELWPALIVGIFTATSLAMLVGTLESVFLVVGQYELIALYTYAVIQPLFRFTVLGEFAPELRDPAQIIDLVLKSFALAFKLGLFVVVHRQLKSGRLAFYMWRVRDLRLTTTAEWQHFESRSLPAVTIKE